MEMVIQDRNERMSRSINETNHNRQSLVDSNNQEENLDPEIDLNTPGDEFLQEENRETDIDQSDTHSKPTREKTNKKPRVTQQPMIVGL